MLKLVDGSTIKLKGGENKLTLASTKGKFALDSIEFEPTKQNEHVAYDNFDNQRLPWIYGPQVVSGGVTGNAGKLPPKMQDKK